MSTCEQNAIFKQRGPSFWPGVSAKPLLLLVAVPRVLVCGRGFVSLILPFTATHPCHQMNQTFRPSGHNLIKVIENF